MSSSTATMHNLLAEFTSSKPWFVADATRESAEALLYSQGTVGSCLVRPSSKPSCFALSHRAFADMVGHALIYVRGDGSFQLETKAEAHRSLDELLASLEPDVDLATSQFNPLFALPTSESTAPKDKKSHLNVIRQSTVVRSRSGDLLASVRRPATRSPDLVVAELAEVFPEIPQQVLHQTLASNGYDVRAAHEALLDSSMAGTSPSQAAASPLASPPSSSTRLGGAGAPLKRGPAPVPGGSSKPLPPVMGRRASDEQTLPPPKPAAKPVPRIPSVTTHASAPGSSPERTEWTPAGTSPPVSPRKPFSGQQRRTEALTTSPSNVSAPSPPVPARKSTTEDPADAERPEDLVIEDGAVKAGSIEKLVERLTHPKHADPRFVQEFLLTYRSFTTPADLLVRLRDRYRMEAPAVMASPEELEKWKKRVRVPVRLRVVNVLRGWVSRLWVDFEADPTLAESLVEFIEADVTPSNEPLARGLLRQVSRNKSGASANTKTQFSEEPPKALAPPKAIRPAVPGTPFVWEDYHLTELARQMTLIEYDLYRAVQPWELFETAWSKKDKEVRAPNVLKMVARFNNVSAWVRSEITRRTEIRERALTVQRLIDLADKCRQLNNLNSLAQIVSGLNSSPIHRMRRTWDAVPAARRAKFEHLGTIMSTALNYKNFREYLHTCKPPCVPYLGMYLTDLTFIEDGCKKFTNDLVNFDKCHKLARVIQEVIQYQETPYNLGKVDYLVDALLNLKGESEDVCYKKSLELEPRRKEGEEPAEDAESHISGSRLVVRRGRIDDPSVFAGPELPQLMQGVPLPPTLEFVVKNSVTLAEAEVMPVKDESSSFQVTGPTADERHTTKNYILHTCEPGKDLIEWMQALLRSGASGEALEELLANVPTSGAKADEADVKAGFLYIRTAGNFLKSRFDRRWVVLDKKSGLLSMGYLRVKDADAAKLAAEAQAAGSAAGPAEDVGSCLFRKSGSEAPARLFVCDTCSTGAAEQVAVCIECIINCHDGHKTPLSMVPMDRSDGRRCECQKCLRRFRKEVDRLVSGAPDSEDLEYGDGDEDDFDRPPTESERVSTLRGPSLRKMVSRKFATAAKGAKSKRGARGNGGPTLNAMSVQMSVRPLPTADAAVATTPPDTPPAAAAADDEGEAESPSPRDAADAGSPRERTVYRRGSTLPTLGTAEVLDDYESSGDNELTLTAGERLVIYRKNDETGWWLCERVRHETDLAAGTSEVAERGWCPRDFLSVVESSPT